MDALTRAIVTATQDGLPLVPRPYAEIARRVGVSEAQVLERMRALLASNAIRRIGAIPNHYALGFRANGMTVWDVDDAAIAELGPRVGALAFVSHCYRRPRRLPQWPYNLFAMVHGRTREEVEAGRVEITRVLASACRASEVLYSKRMLKKTGLRLPTE